MKRARVSIMERKQTATRQRPSTKETSMMTPEQAEQLQSWRDERKRRKDQRRVQWRKDDDDDDSVGDAKRAGQNDAASFSDTAKASRDSATASPWSHAPFAIELWWWIRLPHRTHIWRNIRRLVRVLNDHDGDDGRLPLEN